MKISELPTWLNHIPIIAVDEYPKKDAYSGDAQFLSIGKAQWDNEDYSAKVWRYSEDAEKWSRQSEELPIPRILDLAALVIAAIQGDKTWMNEQVINKEDYNSLCDYLKDNMSTYSERINTLARLINRTEQTNLQGTEPNIFSFATSELSQDALFVWIMKWADPAYAESNPSMHKVGVKFIQLLLNKDADFEINSIDVGRQWKNIDIWAEINDNILLIIEDKVETSEHSNQLERYKETALEEYGDTDMQLYCTYVKTGNEPNVILENIRAKGYHTIERSSILECIKDEANSHPLLKDYYNHLLEIETATSAFKSKPLSKWNWYAWQGFYKELEKYIHKANWSYVANRSGGFLAMWWHFEETEDVEIYLQFEERKLCFKIVADTVKDRTAVRWKYHNLLMKLSSDYPEIKRPDRFGSGTYMTIANVDINELLVDGFLDMERIVERLHEYEQLVSKCAEIVNSEN